MDFKSQKKEISTAFYNFRDNPNILLTLFQEESFLLGLKVDKSASKLVVSQTPDFSALAAFTYEDKLKEFAPDARPSILSGREIAELALNSKSRLLQLDPNDGPIVLGSMLKSIIEKTSWSAPSNNEQLFSMIKNTLSKWQGVNFELAVGEFTDLKISLFGNVEICIQAASDLGQLLSKDPKVSGLLPSGADIVYSS